MTFLLWSVPRLAIVDRLMLVTLVPLWVLCFGLSLRSAGRDVVTTGVYVSAPARGGYPTVQGFLLPTVSAGPDLRTGDRLLRIGASDLRGVGPLGFRARVWQEAEASSRVSISFERDGVVHDTSVALVTYVLRWPFLATSLVFALVGVLVILRAPTAPLARSGFPAMMCFALYFASYLGSSIVEVHLAAAVRGASLSLGFPLLLRAATHFPAGVRPATWVRFWPWLFSVFGLFAISYEIGGPVSPAPALAVFSVLLLAFWLAALAIGTSNYRRVDPIGRQQWRWILFSAYLAAPPLLFGVATPFVNQRLLWVFFASLSASAVFPLAILIAIFRYNLLDIDRLLSAATSYSLLVVLLLGGLFLVLPAVSALVSQVAPVDARSARLLVALAIAATVVAASRKLRPHVDRFFFAERVALERGAQQLLRDLSDCRAPAEVTTLMAERIASLLRPETLVSYARTGEGFVPVFVRGCGEAPTLDRRTPLLVSLEARAAPVVAAEWRDPKRGLDIDDADRRALDSLGAAVLVPVRCGNELAAFACLGAKRSGDVYTKTDVSLLAAIGERASAELLRFRDAELIAETRAMVDSLRGEKEEAYRANVAKSKFLAATSHDLRQPLHALGLFAEGLRDEVREPKARALVEKIQASARAMEEMFAAVLDLSKLEAGVLEPSFSDFPVGPLLQRLRSELSPQAEAKEIGLTVVSTSLIVRSDPILLGRILQNLVGNALRYTERGQVLMGCRRRGTKVRIEVWDTGRGIPAARQREVFEEFRRLQAFPQPGGEGSGLGLAIVRRLASVLRHEIALASEPGRGSVFTVTVPRAGDVGPRATPVIAPVTDLTAVRVAVVEDDPTILDAMQQTLGRWGCCVSTFPSAEELLSSLRGGTAAPEVIFVDQELPGARGLDVIGPIRAVAGRDMAVCLVTGDTAPACLQEARAHSVPLLIKPVAPAKLRAVLSELLRSGRQS